MPILNAQMNSFWEQKEAFGTAAIIGTAVAAPVVALTVSVAAATFTLFVGSSLLFKEVMVDVLIEEGDVESTFGFVAAELISDAAALAISALAFAVLFGTASLPLALGVGAGLLAAELAVNYAIASFATEPEEEDFRKGNDWFDIDGLD